MLLINGTRWPDVAEVQLYTPKPDDLWDPNNRLIGLDLIRPESVPHPWGPAIAFAMHLRHAGDEQAALALELFELYLKGLVTGLLHLEVGDFSANDSVSLGTVLTRTWRGEHEAQLAVLKWGSQTVAGHDPECLFFPAAVFSSWPDGLSLAEQAMRKEINRAFAKNLECEAAYLSNLRVLRGAADGDVAWRRAVDTLSRNFEGDGVSDVETDTADLPPLEVLRAGRVTLRVPIPRLAAVLKGEARLGSQVERTLKDRQVYESCGFSELLSEKLSDDEVAIIEHLDLPLVFDRKTKTWYYIPDLCDLPAGWNATEAREYVTFQGPYRGFQFRLHVHATRILLDEIFCTRVAKIDAAGGARYPDRPIRKGFEGLVEDAKYTGGLEDQATYKVTLVNGSSVRREFPVEDLTTPEGEETEVKFMLAVWPGFTADDWHKYRVHLRSVKYLAEVESAEETPVLFDRIIQTKTSKGWPTGFRVLQDEGGEDLGWFKAGREFAFSQDGRPVQELQRGKGEVDAALDLGTSNSILATRSAGPPEKVQFKIPWALLAGPSAGIEKSRTQARITDLSDASEMPAHLAVVPDGLLREVMDGDEVWSAITARGLDLRTLHGLVQRGKLLSGFKWDDARFWPRRGGQVRAEIASAREAYLRDLLLGLAAQVFTEAERMNLRAGFPEAFDGEQIKRYQDALTQVSRQVGEVSGVTFEFKGLVSESIAALVAAGAISSDEYMAGVDVGGGSSDAFVAALAEVPMSGRVPQRRPVATSLRLAGNHILEAVGAAFARLGLLEETKHAESSDAAKQRALFLSAAATKWLSSQESGAIGGERTEEAIDFIDFLSNQGFIVKDDKDSKRRALNALGIVVADAFRAILHWSLLLVATRLLDDFKEQKIKENVSVAFALMGHGWSLLRLTREGSKKCLGVRDMDRAEEELALPYVREVWDTLTNDPHLPSHDRKFLKSVRLYDKPDPKYKPVVRISKKEKTVDGMLRSPVAVLENLGEIAPQEPLGLWVAEENCHPLLPRRWENQEKAAEWMQARLADPHLWGMPSEVRGRFDSSGYPLDARLKAELHDESSWEPMTEDGKAGRHLVRSPLRALYEYALVDLLSQVKLSEL